MDYYVYAGDKYSEDTEYLIQHKASAQTWSVEKGKPTKFLFWTIKPDKTFEEKVQYKIKRLIEYIKSEIDKDLYEERMTKGLLESIKEHKGACLDGES